MSNWAPKFKPGDAVVPDFGHSAEFENFIVHCDAGHSRSPAVAAAISKAFGEDDSMYFKRYRPNMRVYRNLLDVIYHSRFGTS
jgi:predicted protein tyrosine phosphatase